MIMKTNQVLLVEGNDDLHVIYALCERFQVPENFHIEDCKGISNLVTGLPVRLKGSGEIRTIGIVVDADVNLSKRWEQIRGILTDSKKYQDIPEGFPQEGLVLSPINQDDMRFGVWIMPDNNSQGMLEDFASFLIPDNDALIPYVKSTLDCLESLALNRYSHIHRSKAQIHTWLSWQEDPGTPMGLAITKKYLTSSPTICHAFVEWLNRLYQ